MIFLDVPTRDWKCCLQFKENLLCFNSVFTVRRTHWSKIFFLSAFIICFIQALMSLFVLASKDGWVDIMYDGLDAVGVDQQVFDHILYLLLLLLCTVYHLLWYLYRFWNVWFVYTPLSHDTLFILSGLQIFWGGANDNYVFPYWKSWKIIAQHFCSRFK